MTSAHHLATIAQPCDAFYWAHHISTLKLPRTPTGALNLNVDGRHVLGPLQGFGQLWKKTFRIQLKGRRLTAGEVIKTWKEHFSKFWPSWDHFYAPPTGIAPGEVVLINMVIPGDLPIGLPISTGVVVLCADEQSFTFMTLLFAYICYAADLQASDGLHGMRGILTLGLVLLIAIGLDGSALVSNRYWRKAVLYARTGECQICMKNRKRSLESKNPLTGGRAQRNLTRTTSLLGNGQGKRRRLTTIL